MKIFLLNELFSNGYLFHGTFIINKFLKIIDILINDIDNSFSKLYYEIRETFTENKGLFSKIISKIFSKLY